MTAKPKKSLLVRVLDLIFPTFDELRFIMQLTVLLTLCAINEELRLTAAQLFNHIDIRTLFVIAAMTAAIIMLLIIFSRHTIPVGTKAGMAALYFGVFAIVAYVAFEDMSRQNPYGLATGLWDHVVMYLNIAVLGVTISRGAIAAFLFRASSDADRYLAYSVSNVQYTFVGFSIGIGLSIASTLAINHFYDTVPQILLFSFMLANGLLMFSTALVRQPYQYPSQG